MKIKVNKSKVNATVYRFNGIDLVEGINEIPDDCEGLKTFKTRVKQGIFEIVKTKAKEPREAKSEVEEVEEVKPKRARRVKAKTEVEE